MADFAGDGNLSPVYSRLYQRLARPAKLCVPWFTPPAYGALGGRKVCLMGRRRSLAHTGGSTPDEGVTETGHNAWSNRQNELVVRVPVQWR